MFSKLNFLIGFAGVPTAITKGGNDLETTEFAPTIVPWPIVTPGNTDTNSPNHTLSSITTGSENKGLLLGGVFHNEPTKFHHKNQQPFDWIQIQIGNDYYCSKH